MYCLVPLLLCTEDGVTAMSLEEVMKSNTVKTGMLESWHIHPNWKSSYNGPATVLGGDEQGLTNS